MTRRDCARGLDASRRANDCWRLFVLSLLPVFDAPSLTLLSHSLMWTVTGSFDSATDHETKSQYTLLSVSCCSHAGSSAETRLLRPGGSYVAGRKDCHLVIRHPKISRRHCILVVGDFTEEDVVRHIQWESRFRSH